MTLLDLTPDISWIVPWSKVQQLCHLWRQCGIATDTKGRIYLNGHQLNEAGYALEPDIFQLLIDPEFTALLWATPAQTEGSGQNFAADEYEVCVIFAPEQVNRVLQQLLAGDCDLPQLKALQCYPLPKTSRIPQDLLLALLEIVRSPQGRDVPTGEMPPIPNQPINLLLNQRLEQERILNSVTHRIYQNQDLMVTVHMALEQVQQLLRVDRLLIYQLDVAAAASEKATNQVTFEVLSSTGVKSFLHREETLSSRKQQQIYAYYQQGGHLALNDTTDHPQCKLCLPQLKKREQPQAILSLPLIVDTSLWGLLVAHQDHACRRWRKNEITFLYHVAEYLAIAILQARSYQQLQEQKTSLETLAKQRAKELEDALLSAQVASQSKKEFIHIMSHELLTPLTSIIGLSNTLSYWSSPDNATKFPAEKQQTYLKTIHESGLKLRNLLQDILDFSQTEAARSVLDLQQFSLKQLCLTVVNSFQEMSQRQGLIFKFVNQLNLEDEVFYADPVRLEKILTHLLSNAIKFTSHGGEVTFTVWREKQRDVIFQIKDTGIGIPPQQMPLLFEKFQQLEPSISRSHDGAGFGLALVKQLVEIHQGQIHVTSAPKKGSTFTVRIPCQNKSRLHPVSKSMGDQRQGGTIVLVSQDEEVATLICDLLTATNYQVIWLIDGAIAIDQVLVLQPILVILDGQQQEHAVEEIIYSLQNAPRSQQIPAILVSDPLSDPDWQQLQKRGFRDYLQKPIHSETLINMVNYHVMRHYSLTTVSSPTNSAIA